MMSCFSSPQGVWAQIVARAPSPEVEELASMIGVHMINTNENLWKELSALKEIVSEFLSMECESFSLLDVDNSFQKARRNSHHHNSGKGRHECQDSDSESAVSGTLTNDELLQSIEGNVSVAKIGALLPLIRQALSSERQELEDDIKLLQTTMDTESETMSRESTPRTMKSGGSSSTVRVGDDITNSRYAPTGKSVVIIGPGRVRKVDSARNSRDVVHERGRVSSSRFTKELDDLSSDYDKQIECEYAPEPSLNANQDETPRKSHRSRIRCRIENARDERFFMDEDIFLKK